MPGATLGLAPGGPVEPSKMSVNKTFMGRVFLPPAPSAELHINIGWNTVGNQSYPEWMPLFAEAISKEDYDRLTGNIKAHLETNAIPFWQTQCALCCCGMCVCCPCVYVYFRASAITKELKQIAQEFNGARVEFTQMAKPTGFGNLQAFDQYGQPPMSEFGATMEIAGVMKPSWPLQGYNIILKAPVSYDIRSIWPGVSGGAANLLIPGGQMPAALPVAAPVVAVMARGGGGATVVPKSAAERLSELKGLLDDGLINEEDFADQKAKVLEAM